MNIDQAAPDSVVADAEEKALLRRALASLPRRERRLLALRFGLDGPPRGLAEAARFAGVPADEAEEREQNALGLLREAARAVGLADPALPEEVAAP